VLAAVFGAIRAATTHVWLEGGQPWRQGNWLTAVLWVVSIAAHLGPALAGPALAGPASRTPAPAPRRTNRGVIGG
jgi:hypothetical protein